MTHRKIRTVIVGVGNCASALIQGVYYCRNRNADSAVGVLHWEIDGLHPGDIEIVGAFDIDSRKVGRDVNEAIFAKPNCTAIFCADVPPTGVKVRMGRALDGVGEHMEGFDEDYTFLRCHEREPTKEEVVRDLTDSGADVLVNFLPVGSEAATAFYAECALQADVAFVNCIPVFIASNPTWQQRFRDKNIPLIGDDIKSQMGATIVHRALAMLFGMRGVKLTHTYQLNVGGNTDFLNMREASRLSSKKISKTEAVRAVAADILDDMNISIGPSDYVAW